MTITRPERSNSGRFRRGTRSFACVVSSALTVRGVVAGMSAEDFIAAAEAAKDGCPISQALKGNVELSVDATLEG